MPKQEEINYYKKLGPDGIRHSLDKPFSDNTCSRYLLDISAILSLLPEPPAKLLDLGVGTGWTSVFFAKRGYDVVAQDIAEDAIYYAEQNKDRHQLSNIKFVASDYENMTFDNEFDCAVFYDCLHHAQNENVAIEMVYKALRPGGMLITLEPGCGHSQTEATKLAMELYGTTEKDMPPYLIMQAGLKAGFRSFKLYERPLDVVEIAEPIPIPKIVAIKQLIQNTFIALKRGEFNQHYMYSKNRFDLAMRQSNIFVMKK